MKRIRTKIICTMGPAVATYEKLVELVNAGMNVARLNFSHGTHASHAEVIALIKRVRSDLKVPLAIMLDTKGPEIRLRDVPNNELKINSKDPIRLVQEGQSGGLPVTPSFILDKVEVGMELLFDDGCIASTVIEKGEGYCLVEAQNAGVIRSGKGINIPQLALEMPSISSKDLADIRFGASQGIDLIAASFVRAADDVLSLKRLLEEEGVSHILVFSKIENRAGVENIDSIIQVSDGIMVARGDLGVEVPIAQVPQIQKMIIQKCYLAGKPSVTATQMLESMIYAPRPTRAEASDVANAVYDSTSAVMLSAETAVGRYPVETVRMMRNILMEAEKSFNYSEFFTLHGALVYRDVPSAVTHACVKAAYSMHASALFCFTASGRTARLVSRLRPSMAILALTPLETVYHQLAIEWGVVPCLSEPFKTLREAFSRLSQFALERELVDNGALVVVSAGSPFGMAGTTNMMLVESIGEVLVRGFGGLGAPVHGKIAILYTPDGKRPDQVRGKIIVLTQADESYHALIEESLAVILQNSGHDQASETYLLKSCGSLKKSLILRADGALEVLKEEQLVTLDPTKALVYKGESSL